jgi:ferredoxin
MPHILYIRQKCIGCNACVEADPSTWRISTRDGRSTLIGASEKKGQFHLRIRSDELPDQERAARNCPVKAIIIQKN